MLATVLLLEEEELVELREPWPPLPEPCWPPWPPLGPPKLWPAAKANKPINTMKIIEIRIFFALTNSLKLT